MGLLHALLESIKSKLWPLRPTLVTTVMIIIVCTTFAIGLPSYFSARKAIKELWLNLGDQIGSSAAEISQQFLNEATPPARLLNNLAHDKTIDLTNKELFLDIARDIIKSHQVFTWVAFAGANGDYTAAYTLPNDHYIHGTIRTIESYNAVGKAVTKDVELVWMNDAWLIDNTLTTDYDPRTRPFWKEGFITPEGSWSSPFADWQTGRPSFAYTLPYVDDKGTFLGLWEIEFRADYLSEFLSKLKIGHSGQAWIITDEGLIVADSSQHLNSLTSIYDLKDGLLADAWKALEIAGERTTEFSFGDYFAYIQPFSTYTSLSWKIMTVAPKSDFLGELDFQTWITLGIGISLCILFSFCGALFFGHISAQLKAVAYEMVELGNLRISDKVFGTQETFVKEVQMMNSATDKLKIGLNAFAKYVPLDIVHNLILSGQPATLGGRKNEMTVLFSDLTNFTDLSEQLPPVRLLEILSHYFTEMGLVIQEHQGLIDKFIGDAIMAFWGAPDPLKEHAKAACTTALAMQERFSTLTQHWKISNMPFISQRIGINTGEMIVGNIGSPTRMQYTVIGDAVNLGSRLEGLNKFYGTRILVNETTARLASPTFIFRPLDWVFVKGRHQTSLIYELVASAEKISPEMHKAIDLYEQGLYLYRNREFIKAAQKFEEAHEAFASNDKPSALMAERARNYVLHPPADDWSGVTLMQEK